MTCDELKNILWARFASSYSLSYLEVTDISASHNDHYQPLVSDTVVSHIRIYFYMAMLTRREKLNFHRHVLNFLKPFMSEGLHAISIHIKAPKD